MTFIVIYQHEVKILWSWWSCILMNIWIPIRVVRQIWTSQECLPVRVIEPG